MNKILKLFTIFLSCSLFLSCGYKVVNKMNKNDYSISEITTTGAPRISFIIKNRLLYTSSKESKNIFNLSINTNKKRICIGDDVIINSGIVSSIPGQRNKPNRKVCSRLTTGQLNGYPGYSRNMQRFG